MDFQEEGSQQVFNNKAFREGQHPSAPRWATLHNYRSRQVYETLNGVNPYSSFNDMRSAKSGPNLWQILQVFGPWPIWGKWANDQDNAQRKA